MIGKIALVAWVLVLIPLRSFAYSEEEIIKFIDQRNYEKVYSIFPENPTGDESYLVFKAHAQLGLAGFEPLELIQRIRAPQVFSTDLMVDYFKHCPNDQIGNRYNGSPKCLVLRFFNQIPEHSHPMLEGARKTFALLHSKGRLGRQDRVLFSIVELSMVFSKLRNALYKFNALDENSVSYEEATEIFSTIRSAGEDFEVFLTHYKDIEVFFQHQIFGAKVDLFFQTTAEGKVEFLQKTGLPLFFKVTDMSNEGTVDLAGRSILVHALDRTDYFFKSDEQEFPSF